MQIIFTLSSNCEQLCYDKFDGFYNNYLKNHTNDDFWLNDW